MRPRARKVFTTFVVGVAITSGIGMALAFPKTSHAQTFINCPCDLNHLGLGCKLKAGNTCPGACTLKGTTPTCV
jgi:hypothetical protein